MKRLFLFIGLLLTINNLTAQKKVTENTKANGIESVYVHLKFAQNIIVENWNKNEIAIEATVNLNDNTENDYFSFKTDTDDGVYTVKSDYGDFFKKNSKKRYFGNKSTSVNYNDCNTNVFVDYIIYVPKNMQLKVKSISGNVDVKSYKGNLKLDLISGNINVKKHSKDMHLKTISGDIDIAISDATFEAKSLTGGIFSNLDIDFDKNKKKGFGSKIYAKIKNGSASLKLNTISGDIYLRKI